MAGVRMMRRCPRGLAFAVVCAAQASQGAPVKAGSFGVGGAVVVTGDGGDRLRAEVVADVKPWGRYGVIAAWRGFDRARDGLVLAGLVYEAAAARPRLVLDLHVDAGIDLDAGAPVAGGGIRTTLGIIGPLAIAFDTGAYLVVDGIDATRLQLAASTLVVGRW